MTAKDDHITAIRAADHQLRSDWSTADGGILAFLLCGASQEEIDRDEKALQHALKAYNRAGHSFDDLPKDLKRSVMVKDALAELQSAKPRPADQSRYFTAIRVALDSYQQEMTGSDDEEAEKAGRNLKTALDAYIKAGHSAKDFPDDIKDSHVVKQMMEELAPTQVTVSRVLR